MNFEIGKKVKIINNTTPHHCFNVGEIGIIVGTYDSNDFKYTRFDINIRNTIQTINIKDLQPITEGTEMSEYDELKARIERLKNGWDKEADDILQEIKPFNHFLSIASNNSYPSNKDNGIEIQDGIGCSLQKFGFTSQCEKLTAFKNALLWLLDHSDIKKDEKQEKIEAVEKQIKEIQKQIDELK